MTRGHELAHAGTVPGLVLAVVRDGNLRVDALGELARDSIVRISSMTKPVVAVAALLLVEDGVLGLDEPLDDLLPELAGRPVLRTPDAALHDTVPLARPLCLRDILTSRMGHGAVLAPCPAVDAMAELGVGIGPPGRPRPGPGEFLARLGALPLLAQPGAAWFYDTPFDVLGVLLARATGIPLPELLRTRILDPLGMRDTGFHVPAGSVRRGRAIRAARACCSPSSRSATRAWARSTRTSWRPPESHDRRRWCRAVTTGRPAPHVTRRAVPRWSSGPARCGRPRHALRVPVAVGQEEPAVPLVDVRALLEVGQLDLGDRPGRRVDGVVVAGVERRGAPSQVDR